LTCYALVMVIAGLVGCGGSNWRTSHDQPEVVAEQIAAIDLAASARFDAQRATQLEQIARDPDLDADAQVCLIDVTMDRVNLETHQERVLLALVRNPRCTDQVKRRIVGMLDQFEFDATRQRLLRALGPDAVAER
jgi:hypothetical protein